MTLAKRLHIAAYSYTLFTLYPSWLYYAVCAGNSVRVYAVPVIILIFAAMALHSNI